MRTHTETFKENIKKFGRELTCRITYNNTTLSGVYINSINFNYKSDILKSVMKQLEIDSNVNIPLNTILKYEIGLKVGNQYEYIDMGNFIVKDVEKQEDTYSYKITCCDKMLYSMKKYENMNITYPITIRNYINSICTYLGITFENATDNFVNYDKEIPYELYLDANGNDLGYTFRDVLDELAQATASTICINTNDELEIRYITSESSASKNLLDKSQGFLNGYINTSGRFISQSQTALFNQKIYVEVGETYCFSANTNVDNFVINLYKENDVYYTRVKQSNVSKIVATIPNDVVYIKASVCLNMSTTMTSSIVDSLQIMLEHNNTRTEPYEDYGEEVILEKFDESFLKDVNVKFGEKYGIVNSVVLSRSAESDNIARQDTESIETNGLCEIKISENQIMNFNDRDEYLDEIFNQLNGLEYYINDFKSTGIVYLDICDKYKITIGDTSYTCVMFNDEIIQTQGLEENIYTEMPEKSETDYTKTDTTDRRINKALSMVDKQNLIITNLVSETQQTQQLTDERILSLTERTNAVEQNITSTQATIEVMQREIVNGKETLQNSLVTIDINGINVSTNASAISTLMTNEKFVIKSGDTTLAFFGYDSDENVTKAEMNNLTITKYLVAGWHRIEKFERNGENRTGWFYLD